MNHSCGLDFGTSNTTLGAAMQGQVALVPLEGDALALPTAVFFEPNGAMQIGTAAIERYVEGVDGRLMRSLKSVVGSPLIDDRTTVGRHRVRFRDIIARFVSAVRDKAQAKTETEIRCVVHGRPVYFVDDDDKANAEAEDQLRAIAKKAGFAEVSFQFEPVAAALDYERQVLSEEIALIADIGGGTSDFSIIRLGPDRHHRSDRASDILANDGIRIGGTDFDRRISLTNVMPLLGYGSPMKAEGRDVPNHYFYDLATWANINRLYAGPVLRELRHILKEAATPGHIRRLLTVLESHRGHTLAMDVELAKIGAAQAGQATIDLGWVEKRLGVDLPWKTVAAQTSEEASLVAKRAAECLRKAGIKGAEVDALFLTGGSTQLPHVRNAIRAIVPDARTPQGDVFGSVGTGLALEAARRYGAKRRTA